LNDFIHDFKVTPLFDAEYLTNGTRSNTDMVSIIVVKNIDVRIKNIKKHVLYPIIKKHEENICKKTFPLLDIVKIDYRLQNVRLPVLPR